jgi:cysteine desulfurase
MRTIYFDYNATTPLDPHVREAMLPFLGEVYGNPSSVHHVGRRARALLDEARERVAQVWQSKPSEVIFTSGGTESANLAILGTARLLKPKGRNIVTSAIEHHCVLHCCDYLVRKEGFEVTYVPVDSSGRVAVESVAEAIRPDTILVSIMGANNETGTIQPASEIGMICREKGVVYHTDAVQLFGKEQFSDIHQFNADLVSVCAHKFHGPKGAGALYIRSPLHPDSILMGGAHENERRAGTENLAGIIGFTSALERFVTTTVFPKEILTALTDRLISFIDNLITTGVTIRGSGDHRLSNTVAFTVKDCDSAALLGGLDLEGICASSGSACSSGSIEPSHVMLAMGVGQEEANSLVRFSLGRDSTLDEVKAVEQVLPKVIARAQQFQ